MGPSALVVLVVLVVGCGGVALAGHREWSNGLLGVIFLGILSTSFDFGFVVETYESNFFWATFVILVLRVVGNSAFAVQHLVLDHDAIPRTRAPVGGRAGQIAVLGVSVVYTSDAGRYLLDGGEVLFADTSAYFPDLVYAYVVAVVKLTALSNGVAVALAAVSTQGKDKGDSMKGKHPCFEFAPRDDRSSKNEPNRAENDRDRRFQKVGHVSPFSCLGEHVL